jgi:dipeptidyl aminopeptidase/acylaminoacyl peptidase
VDAVFYGSGRIIPVRKYYAQPLSGGEPRLVIEGANAPQYAPPGWLLYTRDGATLFAVGYDPKALKISGTERQVLHDVGAFRYANGTLVYRELAEDMPRNVISTDAQGNTQIVAAVGTSTMMSVSPDSRRVAHSDNDLESDIWIYDLLRGTNTRFTFEAGEDERPVWSPDGARIAYACAPASLCVRASDGTGARQTLAKLPGHTHVHSWSPDGKTLLLSVIVNKEDLWTYAFDTGKAEPYLATPFAETEAAFSPDGRWFAYVSDESGRGEVYVRAFGGGKWQISSGGGTSPAWDPAGGSLHYRNGADIYAVTVQAAAEPSFGASRKIASLADTMDLHVAAGGKRFIMLQTPASRQSSSLKVVVNWDREAGLVAP